MSEFVLSRNYTLRSTTGHILNFVKDVPLYVPPVCRKEVAMIGAVSPDENVDVLGPETIEAVPVSPDDRVAQFVAAFKFLQQRNNRGDFTGQGLPSIPALKKIIDNFDFEKKEVETVWIAYREEQNA